MSERLEAWLEGIHAGQFARADDGVVTFTYSEDAPATPISLSLPREGGWTRAAPTNLLDNLVPDREHARRRMAEVYGASGTGTFELLQKAGGDVAGGLLLLPEGEVPSAGPARLNPALDRDVADRINSIKLDPDAWAPRDVPARFSLAGTQGKFALARVDADWYWSNESVPSTHILKPGNREHRDRELAEAAAMTLAADVGVPAPKVAILHTYDQTAFIIERFDRAVTSTSLLAKRLHAEDLAQSIGLSPGEKYGVTAEQIVGKLREVDGTGSLARAFIQQLAFNVLVGNADAHAKNYSVLLRPGGVSLAPIYDVVPTGLYPSFEQELAMRISGARYPQAVSRDHWRKFARRVAMDPDDVVSIVSGVAIGMAEMNDSAWVQLDDDHVEVMRATVERNTALALTEPHRSRTGS
ncbi:HipA domain-containing protein [Microbacterium sp. VKM Ac-2923]|uniref:HipA domain-containing protein n=1 Tax=Microbacterium sp. VKM Ac-2923 TaxID=2929476 RepID=UPI001FB296AC|nr:HipA domain-containing protein [Microbacterium sp. VKM Ac-2923]MCJ1707064.1 HipA domain-containing protein [Microbacterium sp. VKM Ac-2923]